MSGPPDSPSSATDPHQASLASNPPSSNGATHRLPADLCHPPFAHRLPAVGRNKSLWTQLRRRVPDVPKFFGDSCV